MTNLPDWYYVALINSEFISLYVDNFINNTSHFQINDARQLPIVIPQKKIFELLGLSDEDIKNRFGFFIEAFKYGAPPHAGLAIGLERFTMLLSGTNNIKDVIAFPKTQSASDLMSEAPSKVAKEQFAVFNLALEHLQKGLPCRSLELTDDEQKILKSAFMITSKPTLYVANISQEQMANTLTDPYITAVREIANKEHAEHLEICADIEAELAELDADEFEEYKREFGIEESGLNRLIKASYHLLGLISYLTAGEKEVRAWTVENGATAPQAAGKIHSDIERGFIRAEVCSYADFEKYKSLTTAKENGRLRLEGKDYIVQDGDIMYFRFNV